MDQRERQAKSPPEVQKSMAWLRNKSGMKIKTGVLHGKRVEYFKGKSAIKALMSPAYAKAKGVKKVTSEEETKQFLQTTTVVFFVRVSRGHSIASSGPQGVKGPSMKVLEIDQKQLFEEDQYYVWFLEPSQFKTVLGGIAMVTIILAGVMFPLWPTKLRIGVWYLSMAMLGVIALFFGLAIFRLIFYILTIVVAKPGIWIFPNLFADVGFVDSFIPGWEWDVPPPKKKKRKAGEARSIGDSSKNKKKKGGSRSGSPLPPTAGAAGSSEQQEQQGSATITELSD